MSRRRWRFITIAAFLLFVVDDTQSQDENDFYYTPVERNFAQVQPPLFPNSRPTTYIEQRDGFRVPTSQQPIFNEEFIRFPSPSNYNQNPSRFSHTGRSQAANNYYVNQPEFVPQRQRLRPPVFQLVHPASTQKPDLSQIHSIAYQHDPSKPEQFLGQITLNNPDLDYLQNNRFKNIPFDGNSLKSNGQNGHIVRDEDIDNVNQAVYDNPRVTTYNPNKYVGKLRLNLGTSSSKQPYFNTVSVGNNDDIQNRPTNNHSTKLIHSNDKALLDLEPLLEDDISDLGSFRELMKNTQESYDVQVINSRNNSNTEITLDSKPDASSMNTDNLPKNVSVPKSTNISLKSTPTSTTTTIKYEDTNDFEENPQNEENHNNTENEEEYVEYYDETESPEKATLSTIEHTTSSAERATDIYDEYDESSEETESTTEKIPVTTELVDTEVKPTETKVEHDNFNDFVDTDVIDESDGVNSQEVENIERLPVKNDEATSLETPSILGQEVVSVVTTKSVVNGTISIPDVTFAPSTTRMDNNSNSKTDDNETTIPVTTENWVVVASVQTSRSVSGARFLPFPSVEQEEKKQVLTDENEEEEDTVTLHPMQKTTAQVNYTSSTENINDKLDSIQSELSSSVLSGTINEQNENIEHLTETTTEQVSSISPIPTTTQGSLNVFTLKSTQPPTVTEKSSPEPLPVMIKKFTPRVSTSTTPKPKKKLVTIMDDLTGFLPSGYKPRLSFKDKRTSTIASTTTSTTTIRTTTRTTTTSHDDEFINGTQGRSSGINGKNKVIVLDDKSLVPKEYKINEKPVDDLFKKFQKDDVSKFLPPDFVQEEKISNVKKESDVLLTSSEKPKTPKLPLAIKPVDITAFLPPGYKLNSTDDEKPNIPIQTFKVADISSLLPPGFKLNKTDDEKPKLPVDKFKVADISSLLPPSYKLNNSQETTTSTTKAPGGFVVFPTRLAGKSTRKTTPKPKEIGPPPVTPKIQKGWPTRASTEFTGWPTSSTTPFSIEKFLNKAGAPSINAEPSPDIHIESTTKRATTTTTTTLPPPPPTTPGVCKYECDIAATIKIVSGVKWIPELLDHHTEEWQRLAKDVKEELNNVYSKSEELKRWYKGIRIDGFTKGSVLVDYFIELKNVEQRIDTLDLKKLFHKSLHSAKPGSVVEVIEEEAQDFDPDVMLGDQPEEQRMRKSDEKMTKTIDKSAGKLEIGKFVMDPAYTEFIVLPKREEPSIELEPEEESFLPQWGIAVIVIAMASLLFVVIFGVTVLVNRQKSAKAKQPIPLSEDMLRELDKSHMGGYDDMHQMKESPFPPSSGKRISTAFIEQLTYANPGDSWRSEWTPQMHKYMQHYTPDSGRGSQLYGASGGAYGYGGGGGSQLYGETGGGGGSAIYGYTGEYPRSHYSRRRSHYDSNF